MRNLINQIEASLSAGLYYLSLFGSLSVPDIAGALSSEDGEASGKKYAEWYDAWVRPRYAEAFRARIPEYARSYVKDIGSPFTGDACYRFRCSLLHQGSSQHSKSAFSRIIFIEPGATTNSVHYCQMNGVLCIDLSMFCQEVIAGTHLWLDASESTERYIKNYERFARRHPNGLPPYIGGVAVVG